MKLAIYIEDVDQTVGGGFTFQDSVIHGLSRSAVKGDIEYIFVTKRASADRVPGMSIVPLSFYSVPETKTDYFGIRYANYILNKLLNKKSKIEEFRIQKLELQFEKLIKAHDIRLVWFISPDIISVKVPFISTVWDLQHRLQPVFPEVSITGWDWDNRESHYQKYLPKSSAIIVGTERGKRELCRFYSVADENVYVVPFSLPPDVVNYDNETNNNTDTPIPSDEKYLLYPAQFWPHKNHIGLLEAISIQEQAGKNTYDSLVLVGSDKGNLGVVKEYAEKLNLTTKVHFLGFVDRKILLKLYKNALMLVYPSYFGPDNIPPLEAIGMGCPICVADVPGTREQLRESAVYFAPDDSIDIAAAIEKTLNLNNMEKEKMKNAGSQLSVMLTSEIYVTRVYEIIYKLKAKISCWKINYKEKGN